MNRPYDKFKHRPNQAWSEHQKWIAEGRTQKAGWGPDADTHHPQQGRDIPETSSPWAEQPESALAAAAKKAIAEGALDQLSDAQKWAFELVVTQGYSEREAARIMGVGRTTVQSYVARAGRVLRAIIQKTRTPKCRPKR